MVREMWAGWKSAALWAVAMSNGGGHWLLALVFIIVTGKLFGQMLQQKHQYRMAQLIKDRSFCMKGDELKISRKAGAPPTRQKGNRK